MANLFIPSISKIGSSASRGASFGGDELGTKVNDSNLSKGIESAGTTEFAQKLMSLLGISEESVQSVGEEADAPKGTPGDGLTFKKENLSKEFTDIDVLSGDKNKNLLESLDLGLNSKLQKRPIALEPEVTNLLAKDVNVVSEQLNAPLEKINKQINLLKTNMGMDTELPKENEVVSPRLNLLNNGPKNENNTVASLLKKINSQGKNDISTKGEIVESLFSEEESVKNKNIRGINNYKKISGDSDNILKFSTRAPEKTTEMSFKIGNELQPGLGFKVTESASNTTNINSFKNVNLEALDLSSIPMKDTASIVNEVTNYIERNRLENSNELSLTVRHEELGNFKVDVSKLGKNEKIDLKLSTTTAEGSEFFKTNESSLIKSLSDKGIQISSLKVTSLTDEFSKSDLDNNGFKQGDQQSSRQQRQFGHHHDQGKQKRQQLWQAYQEQMGA